MFPTVKVSVQTNDIHGLFYVFLDVVPVDQVRKEEMERERGEVSFRNDIDTSTTSHHGWQQGRLNPLPLPDCICILTHLSLMIRYTHSSLFLSSFLSLERFLITLKSLDVYLYTFIHFV